MGGYFAENAGNFLKQLLPAKDKSGVETGLENTSLAKWGLEDAKLESI